MFIPVLHPEAACKGSDVNFFSKWHEAKAIAICEGCPEREACLAGAQERGEEYGVWGGVNFSK